MKHHRTPKQWLAAAATGLALAFSASSSWAVPDMTLGTFDADLTGAGVWGKGWGNGEFAWDAIGTPSGSLYCSGLLNSTNSDTPVCVYAVNAGNPWWHPSAPFDFSLYKSLEFDLKWNNDATNLPMAQFNYPSGDAQSWADSGLNIQALYGNGEGQGLTNLPIVAAAANGWTHISIPINPTLPNLTAAYGVWIRKWICNPPDPTNPTDWRIGHVVTNNGTYGFWIDNVVLKGGDVPPPPTVTAPVKAVAGANFIAASQGQYDRQEIRTAATNYSWIGAAGQVTYSVNVSKIGESGSGGYELFLHWIPGGGNLTSPDSDWHEPNILMWTIGNNANGSAYSTLRYKTNSANSNGDMYGTGTLGGPGAANYHGTWTITFEGNTSVTMTSPDGSTLTTNIPPDVISIFQATPGMQVNIGGVPGDPARIGQSAVVSHAKITGAAGAIDSDFLAAAPDTNLWRTVATSPNGVQWVSTTNPIWLSWTLPATGFGPQKAASVNGPWSDLELTTYDAGGKRTGLLKDSDLPSVNSGYFRLKKQVASKLQVLLPGETAAPGTPTGKTGTPTPQQAGVPFNIIVNAVDDSWHVVSNVNDTIHLTTTDTFGAMPADAGLISGTYTFTGATLGDAQTPPVTHTITATDVTDPTKAAGTSAPVQVTF